MKRIASLAVVLVSVVVLASCAPTSHGDPAEGSAQLSRAKFTEIVEALKDRDAASLKALFTESALTDHSEEIDDGVEYLLAHFPAGDVRWDEKQVPPSVQGQRVDSAHEAVLARSMYWGSSGEKDYQLFFADFTTNTIDSDNVGIYALGVGPRTATGDSDAENAFLDWTDPFDVDPSSPPAIYIPK